ncbi:hypothetical protein Ancab_027895 [Ancistrocladus abbreviatus]
MRLNGEITEIYEEGKENENELNLIPNTVCHSSALGFTQQVVVGYGLTSKKKKSFLQPKLECLARVEIPILANLFGSVK